MPLLLLMLLITPGCGSSEGEDSAADGSEDVTDAIDAPVVQPDKEIDAQVSAKAASEPQRPDHPRSPEGLTIEDGFLVEKLYTTDYNPQGSWVAICAGPDNTLFVSAQHNDYAEEVDGKKVIKRRPTLFTIKPPAIHDHEAETEVIAHPVKLFGAQGLCYAFGSLYVMESGKDNGLMRVTDTDGDGLYDSKELLLNIWGGGEHGTHAIVPTPDGKGLFLVAGNMSPLPKLDNSRVPLGFKDRYVDDNGKQLGLWDEDHVLPQNHDGRGHADWVYAPGGWIIRVNPDGGDVTLHCAGFRNQYDAAVHPNGELFTYDADMELDLGQPWYRPTRINHAVSGAEFGWRNGTGKWPAYYEDSLPAVVDIGPGSPVGVTFGTGADFPSEFQSALFVLDWTFGTIYATHLKADGATYTGKVEPFIKGKPLPVTDVAIGGDGNMYFTTGGRRGDSSLYRVSYFGNKDKTPPAIEPLTVLAKLRQKLEALHSPDASAEELELIWENLGHEDRFIRFAARVALEHQDPSSYATRAIAESDAMTRILAGLALARHEHPAVLELLLGTTPETEHEKLAWARTLAVAMYRTAEVESYTGPRAYDKAYLNHKDALLEKINGLLPSDSLNVKTEVVRLRVALNDPTVIEYALDLMNNVTTPTPPWLELASQNDRYGAAILGIKENPPPTVELGLAFLIRNVREGWTPTTRQAYFSWLNLATQASGGRSYVNALKKIREQAVATLTDQERLALGPMIDAPAIKFPYSIVQPKGPGRRWTTERATALVEGKFVGRDFMNGAGLYQSTLCSQCHRIAGHGADIGPDLTTAGNKFSVADLMRATIEPSHEISDQFAMTEIKTKEGKTIVGRMIDKTDAGVVVLPDPRQPDKKITVPADRIVSETISEVSTMPLGLVDSLSATELRDLAAFILSGGDQNNAMFKQD